MPGGEARAHTPRVLVSVQSACDAPYVPYTGCTDFVRRWDRVSDAYTAALDAIFDKYEQEESVRGPRRLAWTACDNLMLGICQFDELCIIGVMLLRLATRGRGLKWVIRLNRMLQHSVALVCRTYVTTVRRHGVVPLSDSNRPEMIAFLRNLARAEVRTFLKQPGMLMHDACAGFRIPSPASTAAFLTEGPMVELFNVNFRCKYTSDQQHCLVVPVGLWPEFLLALCMSQHRRLGSVSALGMLSADELKEIFLYL